MKLFKDINWLSVLIQAIAITLFSWVWNQLHTTNHILNGTLTYYALSMTLRTLVPRAHRKGINAIKAEQYQDAIVHFEKSYTFFTRFPWLDRYRALILLSSSKLSYRQMALNNIAFCYSINGDRLKSIEYYHRIRAEFLDNKATDSVDTVTE
jgi:tetratricopeptide (TPR) repeat protein